MLCAYRHWQEIAILTHHHLRSSPTIILFRRIIVIDDRLGFSGFRDFFWFLLEENEFYYNLTLLLPWFIKIGTFKEVLRTTVRHLFMVYFIFCRRKRLYKPDRRGFF